MIHFSKPSHEIAPFSYIFYKTEPWDKESEEYGLHEIEQSFLSIMGEKFKEFPDLCTIKRKDWCSFWNEGMFILEEGRDDLEKYFTPKMLEQFKLAVFTCAQVAEKYVHSLYMDIIKKYGWEEDFKKAKEARNKNLLRFIHAQDAGGLYDNTETYQTALQEIRNGHKKSHWIWYVFPQMKGLGKSEISQYYGINGREEAYAYIENPILRERLIEATQAILDSDKTVYEIFGQDTIKIRACMLLFASVAPDIPQFKKLINKYRW